MVGSKNILLDGSLGKNTKTKLSARISADSFVYGLFDEAHRLLQVVEYKDFDFDNIYTDIKFLNPMEINFIFTTAPFLHTPFQDEDITEHMPSFFGKDIYKDGMKGYRVTTLYGVNKAVADFVERFTAKKYHISNLMAYAKSPNGNDNLYAHVEQGKVHIYYKKQGKFVLYNQYQCSSKVDYLYWISAAYDTLGLTKDTTLVLSGDISSTGELYKQIEDYIPNIEFLKPSMGLENSRTYQGSEQLFFDLYQAAQCE